MGTGEDFARNLRTARERHGWSPTELARRCKAAGLSSFYATTVNRIEDGSRQIRLEEAPAIGNVFHLTVEQMMFDEGRFNSVMRYSVLVEQLDTLRGTLATTGAEYESIRNDPKTQAFLQVTLRADDRRLAITVEQKEQAEVLARQTAGEIAMGERPAYQVEQDDALYERIFGNGQGGNDGLDR